MGNLLLLVHEDKLASDLGGTTRIVVDSRDDGTAVSGVLSRFGSRAVFTMWHDTPPDMSVFTPEYVSVISDNRKARGQGRRTPASHEGRK